MRETIAPRKPWLGYYSQNADVSILYHHMLNTGPLYDNICYNNLCLLRLDGAVG